MEADNSVCQASTVGLFVHKTTFQGMIQRDRDREGQETVSIGDRCNYD